jgi:hypothetical protein
LATTALAVVSLLTSTSHAAAAPNTVAAGKVRTAVDVSEARLQPIPAGGGIPWLSTTGADPASSSFRASPLASDYVEVEYLLSGVANTYSGPATGPAQKASTANPYVTRVLARYPKDASEFSGRVFLEPFNTTAGPDRDPIWTNIGVLLQANGDAWVGVSDRSTSVTELQEYDAVRYADLSISANDLAWDILRQLGGLVKQGGTQSPLGKLVVEHLFMGGYSQSGVETATFANVFHDDTRMNDNSPVFDGYLPAAHSATLTPLQTGSGLIVKFEFGQVEDVDVPVVDYETQSDVEGFQAEVSGSFVYTSQSGASVRRPDRNSRNDKYRLFEIAGAPHSAGSADCDGEPSTFPGRFFVRAAAAQLFKWAEQGTAPPKAPRIEMETLDVVSVSAVDEHGNAVGGVRSPFVDVPLVHYEVSSTPGVFCKLGSRETPLAADVLATQYRDVDGYIEEFSESLDATIDAGFLLKRDRAEILESATEKATGLLPPAS